MTILRRIVKFFSYALFALLIGAIGLHFYWSQPQRDYPLLDIHIDTTLADQIKESSALAIIDGQVWTSNDSGDRANLYQFDSQSGKVIKRLTLSRQQHGERSRLKNYDWEALAQDDKYLYVMDCGNNKGTRLSRSIITVAQADLTAAEWGAPIIVQGVDSFTMADNPVTTLMPFNHDYDCEAAAVVGDQLWLFSKNWQDKNSRLYLIDLMQLSANGASSDLANNFTLAPQQTLAVDGLITGADYNPLTGQLVLLGYSDNLLYKHPFIWLLPVVDQQLMWAQGQRFNLMPLGQWESISWQDDKQLLLTAEASMGQAARLGTIYLPKDDLPLSGD